MDLVSLAASSSQMPDVAVAGANEVTGPGTVDVQQCDRALQIFHVIY